MSNKVNIDGIKSSVRRTSPQPMLIDPVTSDDEHVNIDVNIDVNRNVNVQKKKRKFEERFSRATVYIENDLLALLNQISEGEKGEKTRIVNDALRAYLKHVGR